MKSTVLIVTFFAFLAIASSTNAGDLRAIWSAWKLKYKKYFSPSEDVARFGIFVENLIKIQRMNAENRGVTFAINQFADLTADEFRLKHTNKAFYNPEANNFIGENIFQSQNSGLELPDSVDWRQKGAVTPVRNQGNCGSCWAFSPVGLAESFYFINNGELENLSTQQVVDCAHEAGYGCQGGWPYLALDYACKNGLERESDYPYTGKDSDSCHYDQSKALKVCGGYQFVTTKSTDALKEALVNSPASVLVEADQSVFQFYRGGVITTSCGADLNHAVLVVGYQKVGALEAFIVKNSWGTDWGDKGYVLISTIQQINQGQGVCGILAQPVVPQK